MTTTWSFGLIFRMRREGKAFRASRPSALAGRLSVRPSVHPSWTSVWAFEPEVVGEAAQGLADISAPAALPVLHTCPAFPSSHSTAGSSSGETRVCASLNLVAARVGLLSLFDLVFSRSVGRSVSPSVCRLTLFF